MAQEGSPLTNNRFSSKLTPVHLSIDFSFDWQLTVNQDSDAHVVIFIQGHQKGILNVYPKKVEFVPLHYT